MSAIKSQAVIVVTLLDDGVMQVVSLAAEPFESKKAEEVADELVKLFRGIVDNKAAIEKYFNSLPDEQRKELESDEPPIDDAVSQPTKGDG